LMRLENLSLIKGPGSSKVRAEMLRQAALLANQHLREEDIVARLDGDVLGLLLPDTTGEDAKALLEYLRTSIAQTLFESSINGLKLSLESVVGVSAYAHNGASRDELVALASRALQFAEVEDDARTFLMTDAPDAEDNAS
jgi:diguanylate cyclase (GGDEF)-like protein